MLLKCLYRTHNMLYSNFSHITNNANQCVIIELIMLMNLTQHMNCKYFKCMKTNLQF